MTSMADGHRDKVQSPDANPSTWHACEQDEIKNYLAAQDEEAEALAAIHSAQRTLHQAREAQANSRLHRGLYRSSRAMNPGEGGGRGTDDGTHAGSCRPMGTQLEGRDRIQLPNKGQEKCTKCGGEH